MLLSRENQATLATLDLHDVEQMDLGSGVPALIPSHIPSGANTLLQSEDDIQAEVLILTKTKRVPTLINARQEMVTVGPSASFFNPALSFGMMGSPIDTAVLEAMQVSVNGDVEMSTIPDLMGNGKNGPVDLVHGING